MRIDLRSFSLAFAFMMMSPPSGAAPAAKPAGQTGPRAPAERVASGIVTSFHDALHRGDTETAASQLSDDVLIFEGGGVERSRAEYVSHHLPADAAFAKATTRTVTAQSAKAVGDFAWVATESRTTGTFKGRAINNGSTETMVLRREDGTWRIIHIHWSSGK